MTIYGMHSKKKKIQQKPVNRIPEVLQYLKDILPDSYDITSGKTFNVTCGGINSATDYILVDTKQNIPKTMIEWDKTLIELQKKFGNLVFFNIDVWFTTSNKKG